MSGTEDFEPDETHQNEEDDFVMIQAGQPSYLEAISGTIDNLSSDLRKISLEIHEHPELQYKEFHAHEVLTHYLRDQPGWQVTPSAYEIATAFVAEFDSGRPGPVVSFNAEYDALAGIGHACGHNLIAIASVAGAIATAKLMSDEGLSGKVVLFGTPAEEGGGGKIKLLAAGAFRDRGVDISLISHPGASADSALMRTAAFTTLKAEYFGREAHAAARPWDGINALDALVSAYSAIALLRQQTRPGDIIQCQITHGGLRPNIIHAYAAGRFVVRAATRARRDALVERVQRCLEAGAAAAAATVKVTRQGQYEDHVPNWALGARYRAAFNALGGKIVEPGLDVLTAATMASTDQGNVSHAVPSISPNFWIRSENEDGTQAGGPHTPDFEKASRTEDAHVRALRVGKALAATAVDVLTIPTLLDDVKREFEELKRQIQ